MLVARYTGYFENGTGAGVGAIIFPDFSSYHGEFENSKFNGFGVFVQADGCKFEGQFLNSEPHGFGLFTFANGDHGRPKLEGAYLAFSFFFAQSIYKRPTCIECVTNIARCFFYILRLVRLFL